MLPYYIRIILIFFNGKLFFYLIIIFLLIIKLTYFEEYIKKIDMSNAYAKSKYFHSLKSMDTAKIIAQDLGMFNEEEIVINDSLVATFNKIIEEETTWKKIKT